MKTHTQLALLCALVPSVVVAAQSVAPKESSAQMLSGMSFQTLSDTKGTQLNSYLDVLARQLRQAVKNNQRGSTADPRTLQPIELLITIDSQGELLALHIESADTPTSEALWKAARDLTYAPLPSSLGDTSLRLRVHLTAL